MKLPEGMQDVGDGDHPLNPSHGFPETLVAVPPFFMQKKRIADVW